MRLSELFATEASRICAVESQWLDRVRRAHIYRYEFDGAPFVPWAEAEVELRFTPYLGELMDRMLASELPFSFVRIRDARR